MIKKSIKLLRASMQKASAHDLAIACCVGIYIAFCPFIGFHTLLVILFSWLFSLNGAVVFGVSTLINNPWTMVPVYIIDYMFGERMLSWCGINGMACDPPFVQGMNSYIAKIVSLPAVSLVTFLVGGNLLGLLLAALFYFPLKKLFQRWRPAPG